MAYANGQVPLSVLIHLGANFWLPPGTASRWLWFVEQGKARFGVTFRITPDRDGLGGWNAYRPYSAQVLYKKHYGNKAAAPGGSSHGGFFGGREVFAIDVDNWASVSWASFSGLAAEAGFRTNFVTPTERWHIGDFNNPWIVPAFAAGNSKDNDMTPEQDSLLKNIAAFLYGGGPSTVDPSYHGGDGTLYNRIRNIEGHLYAGGPSTGDPNYLGGEGTLYNLAKTPVTRTDGKVSQLQELADSKTLGLENRDLLKKIADKPAVSISENQVKVIADAVVKAIGSPTVSIDYAKIANDVRAKFKSEPLS